MAELYPEIEPYETGHLRVSDLHEIYYELVGNPKGKPAIYLHGGPGSGSNPDSRRYFDPQKYNFVLFDQRGCGRSTPFNELKENTTQLLVSDIEKLREHLAIEKWLVYGGSWGSTLALAYAQAFPQRVTQMVMYGIFIGCAQEISWLIQEGANNLFPDYWEEFIAPIAESERHDMLAAYHRKFNQGSKQEQLSAAKAWSLWESRLLRLNLDLEFDYTLEADEFTLAHVRMESHYSINNYFFQPGQLLSGVEVIKNIPAVIVNGRYDMMCPPKYAWQLHKAWPKSKLIITPASGHSRRDNNTQEALLGAINSFANSDTAHISR